MQPYASPRITYRDVDFDVDVDDEAPTLRKGGMSPARARRVLEEVEARRRTGRTKTLAPVTADATLERFVATPIGDETLDIDALDILASTRELRVRRVGRIAVGWAVALAATVLAAAALVAPRAEQRLTLGTDLARGVAPPETDGVLVGPENRKGETVYVDDVAVGKVPDALRVKCGVAKVRIGAKGAVRTVDIPCGGRVTL